MCAAGILGICSLGILNEGLRKLIDNSLIEKINVAQSGFFESLIHWSVYSPGWAAPMGTFADEHELLQFARTFLRERTGSLQRDVTVCIQGATAAFPALLYCFSTVDLLGALFSGDATSSTGITDRSKAYARRFMNYSEDQCSLLWSVFRHKIVHLAQPKPVRKFKGRKTTWGYWHDDGQHHLRIVPITPPICEAVTSGLSLDAEQRFEISISHFALDIVDSVHAPSGYLDTLALEKDLRDNFAKAVTEIYEM
jgi:hypothetical protein